MDKLKKGDDVAVLLNNLGGTTSLEMMIVARDTLRQLAGVPLRVYTRAYFYDLLSTLCLE